MYKYTSTDESEKRQVQKQEHHAMIDVRPVSGQRQTATSIRVTEPQIPAAARIKMTASRSFQGHSFAVAATVVTSIEFL